MARFVVFIANFENFTQCSGASIVKFEHINAGWEKQNRLMTFKVFQIFTVLRYIPKPLAKKIFFETIKTLFYGKRQSIKTLT